MADPNAREVRLAGRVVPLAPREFDLPLALASEPGRGRSVDDLLRRVWGREYAGESQTVYVHDTCAGSMRNSRPILSTCSAS